MLLSPQAGCRPARAKRGKGAPPVRFRHIGFGSRQLTPDGVPLVKAPLGFPQAEVERFLARHETWLHAARRRQAAQNALEAALTEPRVAALKTRAKAEIPPRVAYFAERMGVQPKSVRITSAKTRFGSCSGENGLCFSWRLMLYPPEAVDYVVVHELAHILEKNHAPAFYRLIAGVLPDYRARERLLKGIPAKGEPRNDP